MLFFLLALTTPIAALVIHLTIDKLMPRYRFLYWLVAPPLLFGLCMVAEIDSATTSGPNQADAGMAAFSSLIMAIFLAVGSTIFVGASIWVIKKVRSRLR